MKNILLYYFVPVFLIAIVGIVSVVLSWATLTLIGTSRKTRMNITLLVIAVFFILSIAEEALRITGIFANYMEVRNHWSWSPYDHDPHNILWNRPPNQNYELSSAEFSYPRKSNSSGFGDNEFSQSKDTNEVKILCLGDSFTEGDGSSEDSSYPRQMERLLQSRYPSKKITVMNAGISGSDPVFGYKVYDSLMYRYHPDIVIQSIAAQDFYEDIALRGGFDRFTADGQVYFGDRSIYGKIYKWSFLSRIYFSRFCGLNMLLLNPKIVSAKKNYFLDQACLLGSKWNDQIEKRHIKMYFALRPDIADIDRGYYDSLFKDITDKLSSCSRHVSVIDLNRFYIDSVDMGKNIDAYFWKQDHHHTPKGYYEMARGTANGIKL